jgi:anti-sigma regulatory factor (Ser/Thr protein kinase)
VPAARHAVREELSGELDARLLDDVELIVSELATNSVRHAGCDDGGELVVEADVDDRYVHLRLCDRGDGFEARRPEPPPPHASGGFGLVLLDRLSDRWGVHRDGEFCVWFEVARSRS